MRTFVFSAIATAILIAACTAGAGPTPGGATPLAATTWGGHSRRGYSRTRRTRYTRRRHSRRHTGSSNTLLGVDACSRHTGCVGIRGVEPVWIGRRPRVTDPRRSLRDQR
jgi:hypothetical protein